MINIVENEMDPMVISTVGYRLLCLIVYFKDMTGCAVYLHHGWFSQRVIPRYSGVLPL